MEPGIADWTDAAAYASLRDADRSVFAWEWLRRDPEYRRAAAASGPFGAGRSMPTRSADERAARWGLHAFEQPELAGPHARPVWRREVYPLVLPACAADEGPAGDRFDLERFECCATWLKGRSGTEHVLLSDGIHRLRLDIVAGTIDDGPVMLFFQLAGMRSVRAPLLVLRQLVALWRSGRFSRALHPQEARASRWILLLRTHDALAAGAGQREIAERLLDRDAGVRRWRIEAPALRSRVQRLAREARKMAAGGYLSLLGSG